MPNSSKHFAVIIEPQRIGLFSFKAGIWKHESVSQEYWHPLESFNLSKLLVKLEDRVNSSNKLADIEVVIIYTEGNSNALLDIERLINSHGCTKIQVLRYEPIEKIIKAQGAKFNRSKDETSWYQEAFLSRVTKVLLYNDSQREKEILQQLNIKNEILQKKDNEIIDKELERQVLEAECIRLHEQINAMQQFDNEQIISFLPIFYRNFWNSVSPTDIALLLDSIKPIDIPSPFPEPSLDTIATKKKRFKQLPEEEQKRILNFCRSLTHKLEIRSECKSIFGDNND